MSTSQKRRIEEIESEKFFNKREGRKIKKDK